MKPNFRALQWAECVMNINVFAWHQTGISSAGHDFFDWYILGILSWSWWRDKFMLALIYRVLDKNVCMWWLYEINCANQVRKYLLTQLEFSNIVILIFCRKMLSPFVESFVQPKARRTRELSAYGKVHSCNLPYAKKRVRATFWEVLFIRAKNLFKVARTRKVFA